MPTHLTQASTKLFSVEQLLDSARGIGGAIALLLASDDAGHMTGSEVIWTAGCWREAQRRWGMKLHFGCVIELVYLIAVPEIGVLPWLKSVPLVSPNLAYITASARILRARSHNSA